jgi:hypothetical protein
MNSEEKRIYMKNYHQEHSEEIKIKHREWYLKNKEAILKKASEYRETHKEEMKEKRTADYEVNKSKLLKRHREWSKNNREKINQYVINKRIKDINFRLTGSLRNRVRKAVKGINKSKSTMELIGCSIEELKCYLEKSFKFGMNWDNYNYRGWHIDHIIPCASFDLSKESEQKLCFHYMNLQPMWREDNQKKGSKR